MQRIFHSRAVPLLALLGTVLLVSSCSRGEERRERGASPPSAWEGRGSAGAEPESAATDAPAEAGSRPAVLTALEGIPEPGSIATLAESPLQGAAVTEEHLERFEEACEAGDYGACSHLGWHGYVVGSVRSTDFPRAMNLFRRACDGGSGLGCSNLGFLHFAGAPVDIDAVTARQLLEQACELDSGLGCSNLGWYIYGMEQGQEPDEARAVELYRRACSLGSGRGCSNLAVHALERGTHEADAEAAAALSRGCGLGLDDACNDLAWYVLLEGRGAAADPPAALRLLEWACAQGQGVSCGTAAGMLLAGEHVERDVDRALDLHGQACDFGNDWSCEQLEAIRGF